MGERKRITAQALKEEKKKQISARLGNCPSSPRKMRLVAGLVRGLPVEHALHVLKHSPQEAAEKMYKLLRSAISNWQIKNEGARIDEANLYIKEILVDGGRMLKRVQPAPQGRAHRIRKRSNHITLILDKAENV